MISLRYIRSRRADIFFYLLASIIPALLLVVINPFLAKNLSPDDYAVIGYISSFASLATPVVSMMLMRYYFVNYFKVDAQKRLQIKRSIIHALILVSFIMSVLVVLAITYYHIRFNSSSTIPLYPYLLLSVSAIWLGSLYVFQLAEYRIRRMSRAYFIFSISQGIFKIILLLILVVLLKGGALGYESATAIAAFVYFCICFVRYRKDIFTKINYRIIWEALKFCWPIALAGALEFFSNGLGRVLLERLNDNVEYGYYSVGNQFSIYMNFITVALFTAFNPDIYECAVHDDRHKLLQIFSLVFVVEAVLIILFIIFAPYIVNVLTAGCYDQSVKYARVLVVSQLFIMSYMFLNDVTIAYGRSRTVLYTRLTVAVIAFFVLSYLVAKYRYMGAAWGQSLVYLIYLTVNLVLFMNVFKKLIYNAVPLIGRIFLKRNHFVNVIYYHDVVKGEGHSFMQVNYDLFKRQMEYIAAKGYRTLRFDDLRSDRDESFEAGKVLIAFDDGWVSNYTEIYSLMKSLGLKYNVFLTMGKIGNDPQYLTWDMVRLMHEEGLVGFGVHSYSHPDMTDLRTVNVEQEFAVSDRIFMHELGYEPLDFCYPFGRYSGQTNNYITAHTSYRRIYTSRMMYSYRNNGRLIMGRSGISNDEPFHIFRAKLKGYFNVWSKLRSQVVR